MGSHEQCDLSLGGDGELQTRHTIAISVKLADGSPAIRFLDLHTTVPLFLNDDEEHHSLVVTTAFAARLGQNIVGAIPLDQIKADVSDIEPPPSSEIEVQRMPSPPKRTPLQGRVLVSSLPPPRPISSYSSSPPSAPRVVLPGAVGGVGAQGRGVATPTSTAPLAPDTARVTVRYAGHGASVEAPMEALSLIHISEPTRPY